MGNRRKKQKTELTEQEQVAKAVAEMVAQANEPPARKTLVLRTPLILREKGCPIAAGHYERLACVPIGSRKPEDNAFLKRAREFAKAA